MHEKSRDKRLLVAKLKSFGYPRHFVKLLTSCIYVSGVYSTYLPMSNWVGKGCEYALIIHLFELTFGMYEVFR